MGAGGGGGGGGLKKCWKLKSTPKAQTLFISECGRTIGAELMHKHENTLNIDAQALNLRRRPR